MAVETLYTLGVFVKNVLEVHEELRHPAVGFKFLDFPIQFITSKKEKSGRPRAIEFHRGKSCLFRIGAEILQAPRAELSLTLFLVDLNGSDKIRVIGSSVIPNLLLSGSTEKYEHILPLRSADDTVVAYAQVAYTLRSTGLSTKPQVAPHAVDTADARAAGPRPSAHRPVAPPATVRESAGPAGRRPSRTQVVPATGLRDAQTPATDPVRQEIQPPKDRHHKRAPNPAAAKPVEMDMHELRGSVTQMRDAVDRRIGGLAASMNAQQRTMTEQQRTIRALRGDLAQTLDVLAKIQDALNRSVPAVAPLRDAPPKNRPPAARDSLRDDATAFMSAPQTPAWVIHGLEEKFAQLTHVDASGRRGSAATLCSSVASQLLDARMQVRAMDKNMQFRVVDEQLKQLSFWWQQRAAALNVTQEQPPIREATGGLAFYLDSAPNGVQFAPERKNDLATAYQKKKKDAAESPRVKNPLATSRAKRAGVPSKPVTKQSVTSPAIEALKAQLAELSDLRRAVRAAEPAAAAGSVAPSAAKPAPVPANPLLRTSVRTLKASDAMSAMPLSSPLPLRYRPGSSRTNASERRSGLAASAVSGAVDVFTSYADLSPSTSLDDDALDDALGGSAADADPDPDRPDGRTGDLSSSIAAPTASVVVEVAQPKPQQAHVATSTDFVDAASTSEPDAAAEATEATATDAADDATVAAGPADVPSNSYIDELEKVLQRQLELETELERQRVRTWELERTVQAQAARAALDSQPDSPHEEDEPVRPAAGSAIELAGAAPAAGVPPPAAPAETPTALYLTALAELAKAMRAAIDANDRGVSDSDSDAERRRHDRARRRRRHHRQARHAERDVGADGDGSKASRAASDGPAAGTTTSRLKAAAKGSDGESKRSGRKDGAERERKHKKTSRRVVSSSSESSSSSSSESAEPESEENSSLSEGAARRTKPRKPSGKATGSAQAKSRSKQQPKSASKSKPKSKKASSSESEEEEEEQESGDEDESDDESEEQSEDDESEEESDEEEEESSEEEESEEVVAEDSDEVEDEIEEEEVVDEIEDEIADDVSEEISDDELPAGWKEAKAANGNVYYYNTATKQSQWTRPKPPPSKSQKPTVKSRKK
eukprot:TRINITY_DN2611_c0_g2_i1.p1 TRINITY_DN2611_c0_g2~~TRINITY_DN2611_c0_g2_i1.p1  ORF type:complete len:1131 (-),score=299.93 TRINITY_DN2611_c0_g2_i1:217-3561(-)